MGIRDFDIHTVKCMHVCVFLTVFITLQSTEENECGKTGHSKDFFYFFEALLDHFELQFF